MEEAIRSSALTRRFGKMTAVEALDLCVRRGSITGFLGPNGAGKTTTIRLLLGLLKPQSGSCEVLGFPPGHPDALAQLGAMVEAPSLYEHLTGLENVEITRLMKDVPRTDTERVLGLVDLAKDARRPVHTYSLGMRQRLGIALALLGEPKLLILDEPNNGLDPIGIQEMRELIRGLPNRTGATIFLSSHILAEVEQVASDLVVIHRGRLRFQGAMAELGAQGPEEYLIRVDDPARAMTVLSDHGFAARRDGDQLRVQSSQAEAARVAAVLVAGGLALSELSPQRASLEARFLALLEA